MHFVYLYQYFQFTGNPFQINIIHNNNIVFDFEKKMKSFSIRYFRKLVDDVSSIYIFKYCRMI